MKGKNTSLASSNLTNDISDVYPTESPTLAIDSYLQPDGIYQPRKKQK